MPEYDCMLLRIVRIVRFVWSYHGGDTSHRTVRTRQTWSTSGNRDPRKSPTARCGAASASIDTRSLQHHKNETTTRTTCPLDTASPPHPLYNMLHAHKSCGWYITRSHT
eukprot:5530862-Prymnesium_polylepis.1